MSVTRFPVHLCVFLLGTIALGATPVQSPALEKPDANFEARVAKTNMYVKALNSVASIRRTYDRYASWVDVKKGVTGKERYITYGLYTVSKSTADEFSAAAQKGPQMPPAMPDLDKAIVELSGAVTALVPLVNKASDYYNQEDFRDDAAKLGQELHQQMMPLFEKTFAAEAQLRRGLEPAKAELDREQLAYVEKVSGRRYEWHLRNYMLAAKGVVTLLPPGPGSPPIAKGTYNERVAELETAYSLFMTFASENPGEMKKVMMTGFVESAVKDFFAASKFLRRTLEAPKVDRSECIERVGELAKKYNDLIQRTNSSG